MAGFMLQNDGVHDDEGTLKRGKRFSREREELIFQGQGPRAIFLKVAQSTRSRNGGRHVPCGGSVGRQATAGAGDAWTSPCCRPAADGGGQAAGTGLEQGFVSAPRSPCRVGR